MSHESLAGRARREYARIDLSPEANERIVRRLLQHSVSPSPQWAAGLVQGFAFGCAAMIAVFAVEWLAKHRELAVVDGAIALNVRGVVEEHVDKAKTPTRLASSHRISSGAWLETRHAASLQVRIGPHRADLEGDTRVKMDSVTGRHLAFTLGHGRIQFDVEPLPKGGQLAVNSGELLVEVVGTVFSVERRDGCSAVEVTRGRVRTTFRGAGDSVSAGETKRYCEVQKAPAQPTELAPSAVSDEGSRGTTDFPPAAATASPGGAQPSGSTSRRLTDEEEEFRRVIATLRSGDAVRAERSLEAYLSQYPNGTFAEEARFHLVRLSYAKGDTNHTVTAGREFLRRSSDSGIRSSEVRLLVAQSLLQQGGASEEALSLLAPMVAGGATRQAYSEQVDYLYVLAAIQSGRLGEARKWAAQYLESFPTGRYSEEMKKAVGP